jgi:hypothetical protein
LSEKWGAKNKKENRQHALVASVGINAHHRKSRGRRAQLQRQRQARRCVPMGAEENGIVVSPLVSVPMQIKNRICG